MNQLVLKKKNELTKNKKGFTLVELIIVIAVIAVLAAIAIPKFGQIKKDANLKSDQANAKIIATAVSSAIADGKSVTESGVKDDEIKEYIDGNAVPNPKTSGATDFTVTYSTSNGVVIKLNDKDTTQVYPPIG